MEALSPRSTNIQPNSKPFIVKDFAVEAPKLEPPKVEPAKEGQVKEHASPPPPWVFQPPLKPGLLAEKFHTGPFLGKGGFAICYEGELRGKNNGPGTCKFAMKIVKARSTQAKVGEKVFALSGFRGSVLNFETSFGPNFKYTRRCVIRASFSSIEPSLTKKIAMSSWSSVQMAL